MLTPTADALRLPITLPKTPSQAGQVLFFGSLQTFVRTITNATTGKAAQADTEYSQFVTEGVLTKQQRIRFLINAIQPVPAVQDQPADSWALPEVATLANVNGVLDRTYFQIIRMQQDYTTPDPSSALALKVTKAQLLNFNTTTQRPFSTFDQVQLELQCVVVNAATGVPVDLEASRGYDLVVSPELPFSWYTL